MPEHTDIEACVRDERWPRDTKFFFNPDRGWFVLEDRESPHDEIRVLAGPHDTILAAAQAALNAR